MNTNRKLGPEEELAYLKEIYGDNREKLLRSVTNAYDVLQVRSQMLLSLVAVVLTITGFSGPRIAASGLFSQLCISAGLGLVLSAAILTLSGPLQLRWATQWRADTFEASLANLIRRRNHRTRKYHTAFLLLMAGLVCYVGSVIEFLLRGAP